MQNQTKLENETERDALTNSLKPITNVFGMNDVAAEITDDQLAWMSQTVFSWFTIFGHSSCDGLCE